MVESSTKHYCTTEEKRRMLAIINSCYFENGILSAADYFYKDLQKRYPDSEAPLLLLLDIATSHIQEEHCIEGILHILGGLTAKEAQPIGSLIVMVCANHRSPVIAELVISCFEVWDYIDGIPFLRALDISEAWMRRYRDEVVSNLEAIDKNKGIGE